ncbi:ATP-binding protein [Neisseria sp. CCUG12390]|uniref:ATP-binding protein n=1 Tax=Neisseria sp. CCUG12390 TaxID=3392035 RepID=UPI003A100D56
MKIETKNALELFFPKSALSLVYFEAIANSLDANASKIDIEINIQDKATSGTLQIDISDNGDGFTDDNFQRFEKLLSPKDKSHKGIGRLVFLKYFKKIKIHSKWLEGSRSFIFDNTGIGNIDKSNNENDHKITKLSFNNFKGDKIHSYSYIKPTELKKSIIEHFLPRLHTLKQQKIPFEISIDLKTDHNSKEIYTDKISLTKDDLPELIDLEDDIKISSNLGKDYKIKLSYLIEKIDEPSQLLVAFNIDNRTVPAENFLKKTILPSIGYRCIFLFSSELFDNCTDTSRQKFNLPNEISQNQLNKLLREAIGKLLSNKIPAIQEKNKKIKQEFEKNFPHLTGYFEEDTVGLIDKDEALENAQSQFFKEQKKILEADNLTDKQYEKSLEFSSRVLTEYILYREKIIQKMDELLKNLSNESEIHNLIVPRYSQLEQENLTSDVYQNNAWLLDDKFMSFRTILSEKEMGKIIQNIRLDNEPIVDRTRPDITLIFSADPEKNEKVDVVVIEIKDKNDDLKDSAYAIQQLLDRSYKLVKYCPNIQRMWYYAIIDIGHDMGRQLRQMGYTPLFSKGKIYYRENITEVYQDDNEQNIIGNVPTPTFIVSFDAIVDDAKLRNNTFLKILRENMKKLQ